MTEAIGLVIRRRLDADMAQLAEVLHRVHLRDGYPITMPEDPAAWLSSTRNQASFVATLDSRLVGHASRATAVGDQAEQVWTTALGEEADRLAVVKRLFVDPSAWGHGIGRRLLAAVTADAHAHGLRPVLDVDSTSAEANALYCAAGFRHVGELELTWTGLGGVFVARCYVGPPPDATGPQDRGAAALAPRPDDDG